MGSKDLHNAISALALPAIETPALGHRLKHDLASYDAQQRTLSQRTRAALQNLKGASMSHKKTFFGASSLAVAILVLGITGYNYQHSPRAQAEQLVNHGLFQITQISDAEFGNIREKFGGDPSEALKEAKQAKDLKVITREEFEAESAKAGGILSASLSSDPSAPSSVSIKGSGEGGFTAGAVSAGTKATTSGGVGIVVNGNFNTAAGAEAGTSGSGSIIVSGQTESGTPAPDNTVTTSAVSGATTSSSGAVSFITATPVGKIQPSSSDGKPANLPDPSSFQVVMPSSYLRYTDPKGRTVVLSLDKDGLPMFKTIFLAAGDLPKHP